jgi:isoamylase
MTRGRGAKGGMDDCLHWGFFRQETDKWYHPKETAIHPGGSTLDSETGGMRTPFEWDSQGNGWVTINVPSKLSPLAIAMLIYRPGSKTYDAPTRSFAFTAPIGMSPGSSTPMGVSVVKNSPSGDKSLNFSVFSRNASSMSLILIRAEQDSKRVFSSRPAPNGSPCGLSNSLVGTGYLEVALDPENNRTGDCWHISLRGIKNIESMCYGWRANGRVSWESECDICSVQPLPS